MASTLPRSPYTPKKDESNAESFWDKFGTLGRKKKVKEVNDVVAEGQKAIDSPGAPFLPSMPEDYINMQEEESRSMLTPESVQGRELQTLLTVLVEWLNDVLAEDRIIVRDLEDDLYDGGVLHKLIERLTGQTLQGVEEVSLSEDTQRAKLERVLRAINQVLGLGGPGQYAPKWDVSCIHSKNLVAIVHLLVTLARHVRAPIKLPENVSVDVILVQKRDGVLHHKKRTELLTGTYEDLGLRNEKDAFDTLLSIEPEKLGVVKRSLQTFMNRQLSKINLEVVDLDSELSDGVHLCMLMGLLEGYYVPHHFFHSTPQSFEERLHNVNAAFELMMDAGMGVPKSRPEDIVNKDLKSTLRVLYALFTKYKTAN